MASSNDVSLSGQLATLQALVTELNSRAAFLNGATAPDDADGRDGDLYLDTMAGTVYLKVSGAWVDQGDLT